MTSDPIDQEKLREWMDDFIQRGRVGTPHEWLADAFTELQNKFLTPPRPTMADVEWDDALHHLAEAEYVDGFTVVMISPDGFQTGDEIICSHNGGWVAYRAANLTPTGRKQKLVPAGWEGVNGPFPDRQPGTTEPVEEPVVRPFATGGMLRTLDKLNTRAEQAVANDVCPEPQPGEAWLVAYSHVPNETFNVIFDHGGHSYDSQGSVWGLDEVTPLHRLAPVVEPRVLRTAEDYENAPNGTVVHQGISGITHRKNCWVWKLYGAVAVDSEDMAGTPRAVIWEPGGGA